MRLETLFRLSAYLTAAAATVALGVAEEPFLPGVTWFAVGMAALFLAAFRLEKRWALSIRASNVVAVIVVLGSVVWLVYQFLRTASWLVELSGVLVVLPYLGPILMVLLLLESFGAKRPSSFWWIHGLCILEAGLGCILASDLLYGAFLATYLTCALWSLGLFYLQRGLAQGESGPRSLERTRVPGRTLGLLPAGRFAFVVMTVATIIFLLTPRRGDNRWDPLVLAPQAEGGRTQSGFTHNVDLNRTGTIEVNDDIAMEVDVEDAEHHPMTTLPVDQRWRGDVREVYEHGRWLESTQLIAARLQQHPLEQKRLPNYGTRQLFFTFKVDTRDAHGLFLADPVILDPEARLLPVMSLEPLSDNPLQWVRNTGSLLLAAPPGKAQWHYRQVTMPLPESDVGTGIWRRVSSGALQYITELNSWPRLVVQPVPQIEPFTREVLKRLVAERKLSAADVEMEAHEPHGPRLKRRERYEIVARALSRYLATAKDFHYSLSLGRQDPALDPVADFLLNTKSGNCELFATSLVLMLRSCGIPARLVMGFEGVENRGNGHYVVRQSNAHSWVEALIQRPGPDHVRLHWLTLDPTPAEEEAAATQVDTSWERWWHDARRNVRTVWRTFVVDYNTEQQRDMVSVVASELHFSAASPASGGRGGFRWTYLLFGGAVLISGLGGWMLRRRRVRSSTASRPVDEQSARALSLYDRLVAVLTRLGQSRPRPGETPGEFSRAAEVLLSEHAAASAHATVPARVVDLFYRARFGRVPLSEAEQTEAERALDGLETALAPPQSPGA